MKEQPEYIKKRREGAKKAVKEVAKGVSTAVKVTVHTGKEMAKHAIKKAKGK